MIQWFSIWVFALNAIGVIANPDQSCEADGGCRKLSCLDINPKLNDMQQDDPELIKIIKEKYLIPPADPESLNLPDETLLLEGQFEQVKMMEDLYFGVSICGSSRYRN